MLRPQSRKIAPANSRTQGISSTYNYHHAAGVNSSSLANVTVERQLAWRMLDFSEEKQLISTELPFEPTKDAENILKSPTILNRFDIYNY